MTTLPIWAVYAVSLGSPALAFLGVFLGLFITRRGAREQRLGAVELEARSQREEAMRTLRWACEQAASPNPKLAAVGVETIRELQFSQRLAPEDMRLVLTAADVLLRPALEAYRLDHDVEVVLVVDEPPEDEGRA
jgi:hypothetical protein